MNERPQIRVDGGCHCGAVRYAVRLPESIVVYRCNCSICAACAYQHVIVHGENFELLAGADNLVAYRFNSGVANHFFCNTCGIKSFYVPRSHPDGYSANLRCLELPENMKVEFRDFDGQNWEDNIESVHRMD